MKVESLKLVELYCLHLELEKKNIVTPIHNKWERVTSGSGEENFIWLPFFLYCSCTQRNNLPYLGSMVNKYTRTTNTTNSCSSSLISIPRQIQTPRNTKIN